MTGSLNIRRNVVTNVLAFLVNIVLTLVSYRLVVTTGGLDALGLWSALTAAVFIIRIGDVGMGAATERQVAAVDALSSPREARALLDTGLCLNGVLYLVLGLIGYVLISATLAQIVTGDVAALRVAQAVLPLMLTGFVFSNLANVVLAGLRGLHLAYLSAWLSMAGAIVQLGVVLTLVPRMGIAGLAVAQLAQHVAMCLAAWILFNLQLTRASACKLALLPTYVSRVALRDLFGFSIKAQAVNFANGLFEPVSKFMVAQFAGLAVLGLYEMAFKAVSLPRNAVVAGVHGTTPAMTRLLMQDRPQARQLYFRSRRLVLRASAAVLGLVCLGSPILSWLMLQRVEPLLIVFVMIMAAGFLGNVAGAPAYTLGFAAGRLRNNMISAVVSLVALVALGYGLHAAQADLGIVVATALGLAVGGILIRILNERAILETSGRLLRGG